MTINQNSANVDKIADNVFSYEGSIKTNEKICVFLPENTTLMVKGSICTKEVLIIHNCHLQVYGNISAKKIRCDGDLGAVDGTIFVPDGIYCLGSVTAGKSIYCDNGKIDAKGGVFAEGVYCVN